MVKQRRTSNKSNPEPKNSAWLGFFSLLAGVLAAYIITQNGLTSFAPSYQVLLWFAGAVTLGFGLTRIFPKLFKRVFQGIGYVAGFAGMMLIVLFFFDKELPSLNGSLNTKTLSGHFSTSVAEIETLADRSKDSVSEVFAEMQQALTASTL